MRQRSKLSIDGRPRCTMTTHLVPSTNGIVSLHRPCHALPRTTTVNATIRSAVRYTPRPRESGEVSRKIEFLIHPPSMYCTQREPLSYLSE